MKEELGEYLRQAREAKNISLKDIQEITKIRLRYLEAIEQGHFELLPGEVYQRGFILNYAAAIGLNEEDILQKFNESPEPKIAEPPVSSVNEGKSKESQTTLVSSEGKSKQAKPAESISTNQPVKKSPTWVKGVIFGVGAALVGIILVGLLVIPNLRHHKLKKTIAVNKPKIIASPTTSPVEETQPTPAGAYPAPIYVEADFSGQVWVRVKPDGGSLYGDEGATFGPSDGKKVWSAQSQMEIRIGNPPAIRLFVNGKLQSSIGESKDPITIKLTPKGIETSKTYQ